MNKKSHLTAKDLLRKSIELVAMAPKGTEFTEENLKEPPLLYRYKQIIALLKALELGDNFESFLSADFMESRDVKDYEKLFKEVKWVYSRNENALKLLKPGVGRLKATYLATLQYRITLHKTLHYWSRSIICDPIYLYPIILMRNINRDILKQIVILDTFLTAIIDPNCKEILKDTIKSRYNYPDVDIQEIDLDYF